MGVGVRRNELGEAGYYPAGVLQGIPARDLYHQALPMSQLSFLGELCAAVHQRGGAIHACERRWWIRRATLAQPGNGQDRICGWLVEQLRSSFARPRLAVLRLR